MIIAPQFLLFHVCTAARHIRAGKHTFSMTPFRIQGCRFSPNFHSIVHVRAAVSRDKLMMEARSVRCISDWNTVQYSWLDHGET
jgi:hypothetical protein